MLRFQRVQLLRFNGSLSWGAGEDAGQAKSSSGKALISSEMLNVVRLRRPQPQPCGLGFSASASGRAGPVRLGTPEAWRRQAAGPGAGALPLLQLLSL